MILMAKLCVESFGRSCYLGEGLLNMKCHLWAMKGKGCWFNYKASFSSKTSATDAVDSGSIPNQVKLSTFGW